jgi:hypothetical protein
MYRTRERKRFCTDFEKSGSRPDRSDFIGALVDHRKCLSLSVLKEVA